MASVEVTSEGDIRGSAGAAGAAGRVAVAIDPGLGISSPDGVISGCSAGGGIGAGGSGVLALVEVVARSGGLTGGRIPSNSSSFFWLSISRLKATTWLSILNRSTWVSAAVRMSRSP